MDRLTDEKQKLETLIQKASSGDESAFAVVYDIYFEKIYRFVYYRVSHKETAEDLVSEVFIKAWDKITEIKKSHSFNGWIYQIARNLVIDHYRSRKISVDIETLENVLEYEDNIVDKANLSFNQQHFLEALKKLSGEKQIIIKLKYLDELNNSEMADILDKPEGTIRVIQHRAVKELKEIIDQKNARN